MSLWCWLNCGHMQFVSVSVSWKVSFIWLPIALVLCTICCLPFCCNAPCLYRPTPLHNLHPVSFDATSFGCMFYYANLTHYFLWEYYFWFMPFYLCPLFQVHLGHKTRAWCVYYLKSLEICNEMIRNLTGIYCNNHSAISRELSSV